MIKHFGLVGAGTMGIGIAQVAAIANLEVILYDINATILRQALERIRADFRKGVEKGKLSQEQADESFGRIHSRTRLKDLGHCDFILEAVIEDLRIKMDLLKHLEADSNPTTI
ncbi:MAG: 3-hydroxyacyl-CoA dehydrogenase family protein, partial [Bacteroidota bacterium]